MKTHTSRTRFYLHVMLMVSMALGLILGSGIPTQRVLAANPVIQQTYYIPLPEDDLLQLFDANDAPGGDFDDPVSPIRSVTSISISSTGTWLYYDQWEPDSGDTPTYEADLENPTDLYSTSNLNGTQIWGDGVLANGCPPSINNVPNPCLVAADDQLTNGDVIILRNNVEVTGTFNNYGRNASQVFFDGRDKFGASFPVAVTRGGFPIAPGSVMAGGTEVLDTSRWGSSYESPLGEDSADSPTDAFEDVRWFIMAGVGGATVNIDTNGDGTDDITGLTGAEGQSLVVDGIQEGATLTVTSGGDVQVHLMTADVDDTFEFRWASLLPREDWSDDYYTPVGTQPKTDNSGCTEVEIYNPNTPTSLGNYRDEFTNIAYNNSDGSITWSNSWVEVNESDGADTGDVQITAGELRIGEDGNAGIYRIVNTSGATSARLTFSFRETGSSDTGDVLTIQQSTNG
ncbi:MAG: hypothetical protein ACK2TV_03330, partial [Anaerolineales bacterium]